MINTDPSSDIVPKTATHDHDNQNFVGIRDGIVRDLGGSMTVIKSGDMFRVKSARIPETIVDDVQKVSQISGEVSLNIDDLTSSVILDVQRVSGTTNIICGDRTAVFISPHSGFNNISGFENRTTFTTNEGIKYLVLMPDGVSEDTLGKQGESFIKINQVSGYVNIAKRSEDHQELEKDSHNLELEGITPSEQEISISALRKAIKSSETF